MNKLINIKNENGIKSVSAKELYLGLGLNKTNWSRWYPTNITENDFFVQNVDWMVARHNDEATDFIISIEFAKHIAMMARTEKSHEYRNYFISIETKFNELVQPKLSKELQAIFMLDKMTMEVKNRIEITESRIDHIENDSPLFTIECKELQSLVRKVGTRVLGGYRSVAYVNKSIRTKVYSDIQHQLKREFGVQRYEAIKRCQLEIANGIVNGYKAPLVLVNEIFLANSQVSM